MVSMLTLDGDEEGMPRILEQEAPEAWGGWKGGRLSDRVIVVVGSGGAKGLPPVDERLAEGQDARALRGPRGMVQGRLPAAGTGGSSAGFAVPPTHGLRNAQFLDHRGAIVVQQGNEGPREWYVFMVRTSLEDDGWAEEVEWPEGVRPAGRGWPRRVLSPRGVRVIRAISRRRSAARGA